MKLYELVKVLCVDQPIIIYTNETDYYKETYVGQLNNTYESVDIYSTVDSVLTIEVDNKSYLAIVLRVDNEK